MPTASKCEALAREGQCRPIVNEYERVVSPEFRVKLATLGRLITLKTPGNRLSFDQDIWISPNCGRALARDQQRAPQVSLHIGRNQRRLSGANGRFNWINPRSLLFSLCLSVSSEPSRPLSSNISRGPIAPRESGGSAAANAWSAGRYQEAWNFRV